MLRRILISALCVCLANMASMPLSACATLMKLPSECDPATSPLARTNSDSHCEQMANEAAESPQNATRLLNGALLGAAGCCNMTSAPVPDAGERAFQSGAASAQAVMEDSAGIAAVPAIRDSESRNDSPPILHTFDNQALLCTFLI